LAKSSVCKSFPARTKTCTLYCRGRPSRRVGTPRTGLRSSFLDPDPTRELKHAKRNWTG
jgi:hypothetical protein